MEIFLALFIVFAFFALIINLTILLFKRIRRNDTTRQKKIIVYNFALFSGAIIIGMIITKESNTSSANNSTTISNTSESSEAAELSQEYIKSSSDIEEENLKKGTLADEIKNELYELDLTEDEMNDIIFAHNTFVPDTAQSYQINPYLGIAVYMKQICLTLMLRGPKLIFMGLLDFHIFQMIGYSQRTLKLKQIIISIRSIHHIMIGRER